MHEWFFGAGAPEFHPILNGFASAFLIFSGLDPPCLGIHVLRLTAESHCRATSKVVTVGVIREVRIDSNSLSHVGGRNVEVFNGTSLTNSRGEFIRCVDGRGRSLGWVGGACDGGLPCR